MMKLGAWLPCVPGALPRCAKAVALNKTRASDAVNRWTMDLSSRHVGVWLTPTFQPDGSLLHRR
jgi:hypothetical protein